MPGVHERIAKRISETRIFDFESHAIMQIDRHFSIDEHREVVFHPILLRNYINSLISPVLEYEAGLLVESHRLWNPEYLTEKMSESIRLVLQQGMTEACARRHTKRLISSPKFKNDLEAGLKKYKRSPQFSKDVLYQGLKLEFSKILKTDNQSEIVRYMTILLKDLNLEEGAETTIFNRIRRALYRSQ